MIKNVLTEIGQVGVFGVIALAIFFGFFTCMVVWAFCLKKPYLNSMGELPVDADDQPMEERKRL